MSEPFLGEMRIFAFNFAPLGWANCAGQALPISQNQALFSLLGTTYGGNGINNFNLPDLRGRAPISAGTDNFGNNYSQGATGGQESHTLVANELALHQHSAGCVAAAGTQAAPYGHIWASSTQGDNLYSTAGSNGTMSPQSAGANSGGSSHENRQPFLVLNVCIALQGIFPSRN